MGSTKRFVALGPCMKDKTHLPICYLQPVVFMPRVGFSSGLCVCGILREYLEVTWALYQFTNIQIPCILKFVIAIFQI